MTWKNKNVLITGATHFISRHLIERLFHLGSHTKAFIRYDYKNDLGLLNHLPLHLKNQIEVIHGNLTNPEVVEHATSHVDVVFHLGALDVIPYSHVNLRDWLEENVLGTFNVLNAALKYGVQKLIHVSAIGVYGETKERLDEEHPLQASSPYMAGRISAEKLVEGYCSSENLPAAIIRLSNAYGPGQSSLSVIPTIITQGLMNQKLFLGNMRAIRDFVYVEDVIDGLIITAETPQSVGEAINIGSGQGISIGDLADKILKLIGRDVEIIFDATRIRPPSHDAEKLVADITKARGLLGWQPKIALDKGLEETIKWSSQHLDLSR